MLRRGQEKRGRNGPHLLERNELDPAFCLRGRKKERKKGLSVLLPGLGRPRGEPVLLLSYSRSEKRGEGEAFGRFGVAPVILFSFVRRGKKKWPITVVASALIRWVSLPGGGREWPAFGLHVNGRAGVGRGRRGALASSAAFSWHLGRERKRIG